MTTYTTEAEQRYSDVEGEAWDEFRAKYTQADREKMAKNGEAMPDGSYPIADAEDLENAIHAVGRGNANHDTIRQHIIARAKALGLSSKIPDNWNADGSLKAGTESKKRFRNRSIAERRAALHTGYERRTFTFETGRAAGTPGLSLRSGTKLASLTDDDTIPLTGYAIRYGTPYDVTDRFGTFSEEMRNGAASDTLVDPEADPVFMYDHDSLVMGRKSAGTLRVGEDAKGVPIEVNLSARQSIARDLAEAISRGDVKQMSVGFSVPDGGDEWNSSGTVRKINKINLLDVSAVGQPASPTTSIQLAGDDLSEALRSLRSALDDSDDPEYRKLAELIDAIDSTDDNESDDNGDKRSDSDEAETHARQLQAAELRQRVAVLL